MPFAIYAEKCQNTSCSQFLQSFFLSIYDHVSLDHAEKCKHNKFKVFINICFSACAEDRHNIHPQPKYTYITENNELKEFIREKNR